MSLVIYEKFGLTPIPLRLRKSSKTSYPIETNVCTILVTASTPISAHFGTRFGGGNGPLRGPFYCQTQGIQRVSAVSGALEVHHYGALFGDILEITFK